MGRSFLLALYWFSQPVTSLSLTSILGSAVWCFITRHCAVQPWGHELPSWLALGAHWICFDFFFFFGSQWILKNDFGVLESIGDSNPPMTIVTMLTDLLNRKSPMIADQQVYVHSHISRLHVWICACQECKFEPVCSVWVLRNRGDKVCDGKSMTQTLSLTLNEDFLVLYWVRELQSDVSWYAGLSHWSLWYDLL